MHAVVGFHNYFAFTTPYGTELIIIVNSSQLVKLLPFLLKTLGSHIKGPQLPKILYKIVQSLKFGEDCNIVTKDCNLTLTAVICYK